MKKRWVAKPQPGEDIIQNLRKDLEVNVMLLKLIAQRGISTFHEAKQYFLPELAGLHDPFLMKDMDIAVARIKKAIETGEKILIYGDYDVDGTTSVALVYSYFHKIYSNLDFYIPDRFKEGYGVSQQGVEWAVENNISLIITLDCGIKAMEQVEFAKTKGIDFIICDHHTVGDEMPAAFAVLNPKRPDCSYPYKELSGCGIGYKLIQAYAQHISSPLNAENYLDLVAISIASDIVPITGENRILAYFGLEQINKKPRAGIKALLHLSGTNKNLEINDLVFRIGPRINAAGRIASATSAVKMLLENDEELALAIALEINKNNTERQSVDLNITQEALGMIEDFNGSGQRRTTVLFNQNWHKGVIGIVASRLIEKYYRPTILLTESNGYAVGSARSVPGFNLYEALAGCSELLEQWGGHQAAAGLTLKVENVDALRERFDAVVSSTIPEELLTPLVEYDLEIPLDVITMSFCRTLERFGPFGPENMKPVFITRNVQTLYRAKIVGRNHLQFTVTDGEDAELRAIGFGLGDHLQTVSSGAAYNICYTIEPNEYRGVYSVNLNIKDIQVAE